MKNNKLLYSLASLGALVGIIASFWQTLEKLTLLKNPDAILSCNLSSVLSCTNILNAWQSSVFGFPNSIMCLIFFVFFFAIALAGLLGSKLSKNIRFTTQILALFMTAFGLWYMSEAIYVVKAVCIFCLFCFGGLMLLNAAWYRLNLKDYSIKVLKIKNIDLYLWLILVVYLAVSIIVKL